MGSTSAPALTTKLAAALSSRSSRQILRKLPDPSSIEQNQSLIDFTSNDYLSFTTLPQLRELFVNKLSSSSQILGSGGSRLLVHTPAHAALESRLANFFGVQAALLFNSGFDANSGFFACVPQDGDVLVYDEYIHASVHDGMRSSRLSSSKSQTQYLFPFSHNSVPELRTILLHLSSRQALKEGNSSLFISVESLYSMDGTFAPLVDIVEVMKELFPLGNAYLVVDEAHATGLYGPQGRGRVAQLGLESKVLMRLCTFGKGLGGTGAVVLTNALIRDYLVNYARPLIYTTSLSYTNIIAADCAFNLLEDGTAESLAKKLFDLSTYFTTLLRTHLYTFSIPPDLLSLPLHLTHPIPHPPPYFSPHASLDQTSPLPPSPIIPLHTTLARPLSAYLLTLGMNARPITWPTVPKGKGRVRVCLHAGNTKEDVERLAEGAVGWAKGVLEVRRRGMDGKRKGRVRMIVAGSDAVGDGMVASKL